ncbi:MULTISPECIES: S-layer homology domain-containing protein [Bacillus cereus group]|uniref:S-layer homology domain-containing protein n=1 Tax=Bacillus cereus group TaxID=86661 RepID=UPI001D181A69|nr:MULTISPECIES: S-layer homology domain-containing protein [Bacillus cereus group]MEB9309577.1 S-layer homology domain-containing protein [Bacillus cereus]MCC3876857.1 S-layer homology domain-containing protein [Bacillus thuringiensis]MCC3882715.1 S-layer homology domain-containing protein [Bacillus thuringiensis]MCC3888933.1 S-layer homology domain-containing protein [Bacillus thuringiensis]MCC3901762.1 S-layer homology domain-containing protein [Bacillus thuringiensis]
MFKFGTIKESIKKLIYLEEQTMANKFLKTATALTIMGTSLLGAGAFTAKADNTDSLKFNDVPANHWSTKAIYDLTNRKVVQGYGNNIFGFGDNVTRGQVARMIYMYVKPADADASFKNPFTDIKGHLFEKEIRALAKAGLVNGFGDGKYGPDDILTREQMAQVLTNAFKFKATKTTSFTDIDKNSWALKAISALEENGVTIGTGGNMYSPYTHVTREQYSQFLYNSINAVEKETKPEVKPDPKPEEKPEVKPDPKPEEKPEVKPDPKPEEKPEVKPDPKPEVPAGVDANLVQPNFKYNPTVLENPNVKQQLAPEAQNLLKEINNKYNTNLKYDNLNGAVTILDKDMYYPEGSYIGGQFVIEGGGNKFKIGFLDNNEATVELTKRWVTYLTGLNVDQEIQETINAKGINNYVKGNYKVRIGQTMVQNTMYIYVEAK